MLSDKLLGQLSLMDRSSFILPRLGQESRIIAMKGREKDSCLGEKINGGFDLRVSILSGDSGILDLGTDASENRFKKTLWILESGAFREYWVKSS
jgi:hypothetical protein